MNQQIAQEILEQAGAKVTIADNGRIAIETLRSGQFDLVLMDVQMPEMDGYQATAEIRRDPGFKNLPVIAITAHAMSADREKCLAAGMNDCVTKPIDPVQLIQTAARYLSREPMISAAAQSAPPATAINSPAVASEALPELLAGVNVGEGLRRLGGNAKLYLGLLRDFARAQANLPEQIQDAVDRGDLVAAGRHAHSLKGAAANLAMPEVARTADDLETVLKDQALLDYRPKFTALKTALLVVLNSLNQLVSTAEPTQRSDRTAAPMVSEAPESALNRAVARAGLAKLREQVAAGDLDAAKELGTLEAVCGTYFRAELEALRQHLDRFDFDQATCVVEALETQLREG